MGVHRVVSGSFLPRCPALHQPVRSMSPPASPPYSALSAFPLPVSPSRSTSWPCALPSAVQLAGGMIPSVGGVAGFAGLVLEPLLPAVA